MKTIITSDDLFIFELLSAAETGELMQWLALYWQECEQEHNPDFINRIKNKKVKAAFTYFNNKWERRRRKKVIESSSEPIHVDSEKVMPDYLQLAPYHPFTSYDAFSPGFIEREKKRAVKRGVDTSRWPKENQIKEFYDYWHDFRKRNPEFDKKFLAREL